MGLGSGFCVNIYIYTVMILSSYINTVVYVKAVYFHVWNTYVLGFLIQGRFRGQSGTRLKTGLGLGSAIYLRYGSIFQHGNIF